MARGEPLIRQWSLLKALQAHRFGISSNELAERLECSKRQILRDLNLLQEVGFPISYEVRDYGKRFWKLSPYFLEREELMLSATEMLSLFVGQKLLAPLAGTQVGSGVATALEKIKAILPKKALTYFGDLDSMLLVKNVAYPNYSGLNKEIRITNQAIAEEKVLKIRYKSVGKDRLLETEFHPYGLIFLGVSLYCVGHVEKYDEVRTLKFTRFAGVRITDKLFDRPLEFSLEEYTKGSFGIISSGELQTIKVKFTGWAATSIRELRWHASQTIIEEAQDYVVAQFELSDTTEFKRWLLGFGRHAKVLKPSKLASEITEELADALRAYG